MKYSEYVSEYWNYNAGEHHLVALFIIPVLQKVLGKLPIYVNPDGMKSIQGDIVYACSKANFSIEVKLKKLCLTKVQCSPEYNPDILLYFDFMKIGIANWKEFQNEYIFMMDKLKAKGFRYTRYGPIVKANDLESIKFYEQDEIFNILQKRHTNCDNQKF